MDDQLFAVLVLICFHVMGISDVLCFQPSRIFADPNPTGESRDPYPPTVGGFVSSWRCNPCGWDLPQAIAQDNLNDVISNIAALWAPEAVVVFFFF